MLSVNCSKFKRAVKEKVSLVYIFSGVYILLNNMVAWGRGNDCNKKKSKLSWFGGKMAKEGQMGNGKWKNGLKTT